MDETGKKKFGDVVINIKKVHSILDRVGSDITTLKQRIKKSSEAHNRSKSEVILKTLTSGNSTLSSTEDVQGRGEGKTCPVILPRTPEILSPLDGLAAALVTDEERHRVVKPVPRPRRKSAPSAGGNEKCMEINSAPEFDQDPSIAKTSHGHIHRMRNRFLEVRRSPSGISQPRPHSQSPIPFRTPRNHNYNPVTSKIKAPVVYSKEKTIPSPASRQNKRPVIKTNSGNSRLPRPRTKSVNRLVSMDSQSNLSVSVSDKEKDVRKHSPIRHNVTSGRFLNHNHQTNENPMKINQLSSKTQFSSNLQTQLHKIETLDNYDMLESEILQATKKPSELEKPSLVVDPVPTHSKELTFKNLTKLPAATSKPDLVDKQQTPALNNLAPTAMGEDYTSSHSNIQTVDCEKAIKTEPSGEAKQDTDGKINPQESVGKNDEMIHERKSFANNSSHKTGENTTDDHTTCLESVHIRDELQLSPKVSVDLLDATSEGKQNLNCDIRQSLTSPVLHSTFHVVAGDKSPSTAKVSAIEVKEPIPNEELIECNISYTPPKTTLLLNLNKGSCKSDGIFHTKNNHGPEISITLVPELNGCKDDTMSDNHQGLEMETDNSVEEETSDSTFVSAESTIILNQGRDSDIPESCISLTDNCNPDGVKKNGVNTSQSLEEFPVTETRSSDANAKEAISTNQDMALDMVQNLVPKHNDVTNTPCTALHAQKRPSPGLRRLISRFETPPKDTDLQKGVHCQIFEIVDRMFRRETNKLVQAQLPDQTQHCEAWTRDGNRGKMAEYSAATSHDGIECKMGSPKGYYGRETTNLTRNDPIWRILPDNDVTKKNNPTIMTYLFAVTVATVALIWIGLCDDAMGNSLRHLEIYLHDVIAFDRIESSRSVY